MYWSINNCILPTNPVAMGDIPAGVRGGGCFITDRLLVVSTGINVGGTGGCDVITERVVLSTALEDGTWGRLVEDGTCGRLVAFIENVSDVVLVA